MTGGTTVLSDEIVVRITSEPGASFVDRMIALVEGSERQRTPNEAALNVLLSALTVVFVVVCLTLWPIADYSGARQPVLVLVALLVCLIPTTIGALLSAIGIAGMDRLVRRNVLAMSGRAVEAAGDIDVLLLDKTGTITFGNRRATELLAPRRGGSGGAGRGGAAGLAGRRDARGSQHRRARPGGARRHQRAGPVAAPSWWEFSAVTRMSGLDLGGRTDPQGRGLRGGAVGRRQRCGGVGRGHLPARRARPARRRPPAGPRWWSPSSAAVAAPGCSGSSTSRTWSSPACRTLRRMRAMGIRTVMITGDNAVTAQGDRRRGRGRRLPGRGDARGQARADPQGAVGRPPGGDVRRRHQRRAGAGPGRRRGRDEHRHGGGQGGRQHGGPRLRPDQADRRRRDRQAAAHHPRGADHLLGGQRRREVLRDPAGDVRGGLPVARRPQRDAASARRSRPSSVPSCSTRWSSSR